MPRAILLSECVYKEPQLGRQGFCSLVNDNAGPLFESLSRKFAHTDDIFINSNLDISIFCEALFYILCNREFLYPIMQGKTWVFMFLDSTFLRFVTPSWVEVQRSTFWSIKLLHQHLSARQNMLESFRTSAKFTIFRCARIS